MPAYTIITVILEGGVDGHYTALFHTAIHNKHGGGDAVFTLVQVFPKLPTVIHPGKTFCLTSYVKILNLTLAAEFKVVV